jgi:flavin reductase (DIM6/NTAB) family NADH-FMN oxidoreductase RutF
MPLQEIDRRRGFTFLESGPVVLVSTSDHGKNNVMTISWHMVMDFTPRIAMSTGPWNHSFHTMMETRECVISVPTVELLKTVVLIGTVSGTDVDKFAKFHLTALPAQDVGAPLIGECLAALECKVVDYVEKHGLVILEATRVWYNPWKKEKRVCHAIGNGSFSVDGEIIDYRSLMEEKLPDGV